MQAAGEAELEAARTQGRQMVAEAQAVRERVLRDLAVRRKKARQQVERLNAGRERLMQAYDVVRRTVEEATDELNTSLSDARLAADAAGRRIDEEPEPTVEQLDEEIVTGVLVDLPIAELPGTELDDGLSPAPSSGEVPAVESASETALAADEPEPDPEPEPEPEVKLLQPEAPGPGPELIEPAPRPDAAVSADEDDPDGESPASVQDLFDRLRAEQTGSADDGATVEVEVLEVEVVEVDATEAEVLAAPDAIAAPEAVAADTPFTTRDAALEALDKELGRRLKRALADEQNEVLDRLRRAKPKGVEDLLPAPDDHAGRWADVASPALIDAAAAGAMVSGGSAGSIADLADELARSLTAPLRDRVDRSFAASDGNLDEVAERVRALYREWKGQRLTDSSRHGTAAAYARGVYDGLDADADLRWRLDPQGGPCPDCDDNVLAGTVAKGAEFPTGHQCAPAHPGCRCLVLPAEG